jgi:hypothetical protein
MAPFLFCSITVLNLLYSIYRPLGDGNLTGCILRDEFVDNNVMEKDIAYLRQILSEKIIPSLFAEDSPRMVLAQHPWRLPADMKLRRRPAPSLEVNLERVMHFVHLEYVS